MFPMEPRDPIPRTTAYRSATNASDRHTSRAARNTAPTLV